MYEYLSLFTLIEQDEGEDADDIPNLQLSWEVLELSKKIYNKQVESADATEADKKAYKVG